MDRGVTASGIDAVTAHVNETLDNPNTRLLDQALLQMRPIKTATANALSGLELTKALPLAICTTIKGLIKCGESIFDIVTDTVNGLYFDGTLNETQWRELCHLNMTVRDSEAVMQRLYEMLNCKVKEREMGETRLLDYVANLDAPRETKVALVNAIGKGNGAKFQTLMGEILSRVEQNATTYIDEFHAKELRERIKGFGASDAIFKTGRLFLMDDLVDDFVTGIETFTRNFPETRDAHHRLHSLTTMIFRDMAVQTRGTSKMKESYLMGRATKVWRDFSGEDHGFCGCQIGSIEQERHLPSVTHHNAGNILRDLRMVIPDTDSSLRSRAVYLGTCPFGNGHNSVAESMTRYLQGPRSHIYFQDGVHNALASMEASYVNAFRMVGVDVRDSAIYSWLVRMQWWGVLRIIIWLSGGVENEASKKKKIQLFLHELLMRDPDVLLTSYSRHIPHLVECQRELGVPYMSLGTDFDPTTPGFFPDGQYVPHYRHSLWGDHPRTREIQHAHGLLDENTEVTGPVVRPAFHRTLTNAELRQEREENRINPDAQVVVVMNGLHGAYATPEVLADQIGDRNIHVIICCGSNQEEYHRLERKYRNHPKVNVKGYLTGHRLNKLFSIAAQRRPDGRSGLYVGKLGGSTLAELMTKKVRVVADETCGWAFPWEAMNADIYCTEANMGRRVADPEAIVPNIYEMLEQPVEQRVDFANRDGGREVVAALERAAERVEADHDFHPRHHMARLGTKQTPQISNGEYVIAANARLNLLAGGQLDFVDGRFTVSYSRSKSADERAALALATLLPSRNRALVELAEAFLKEHEVTDASKDLMRVDRALVAMNPPATADEVPAAYYLDASRKYLTKVISEPTRSGAKHGTDQRVFRNRDQAIMAFARHPKDVDFMKKHHIEKWVGTFDDAFSINPVTFEISVKVDGRYETLRSLRNRTLADGDLLLHGDTKLSYVQHRGIVAFDPENLEPGELVPFKVKASRKHADYRLEVQTVVDDSGDHNHAFLTLKAPDGTVHSIGYFRPYAQEQEYTDLLTSTDASLAVPDRYEHMRLDHYRKRTVIPLTEAQHQEILRRVTQTDMVYNPINRNCLSMMKRVVEDVTGVQLETKSSLLQAYGGINPNTWAVLRYLPPLRIVAAAGLYLVAVMRNLLFAAIGAFRQNNGVSVFENWYDIFNPAKGMPDHPRALRAWQERVEAAGTLPRLENAEERGAWWYARDVVWPQNERDGVLNMA
ncbi:MAG: Processive diacylglycerol beta-glucosyltransferase [Chlamydiia bacterium]|nr:Processive diacylglycerol beta-glucosyltransferase [Chlamydiia bacterium]MCH9615575.1 Processive diacylglycerol beta-glucosyltransferase [Chlamydiia bacterium]MCH9629230.1 Processive diacylglycerol beta-glucosyltransferase [Chlamydiia bacterium]